MASTQPDGPDAGSPAALLAGGRASGTWTLDSAHSTITFAVKHFWGLMTVRGSFSRFTGRATVEQSGAIAADITVDADSLDTKNAQRDKHLRSDDFFDVAGHPSVAFTTTEVTVGSDGWMRVVGSLAAAGHAEQLELDAQVVDATAEQATVDARVEVDRTRFGMTWSPMRMSAAIATIDLHLRWSKGPA
jgi:polyisoprenoid-binding protein YceI